MFVILTYILLFIVYKCIFVDRTVFKDLINFKYWKFRLLLYKNLAYAIYK